MKLLQCTEYALEVKEMVKQYTSNHQQKKMSMVVYSNPNDPASTVYLRNKKNVCEECGIEFVNISTTSDLDVDAPAKLPWIVQFPANDTGKLLSMRCDSELDVDGTNVWSLGMLYHAPSYRNLNSVALPCTPLGIVYVIKKQFGDDISGKKVVIINRSNLVGKPVSKMLLDENCSVTICHSKSGLDNIKQYCQDADIIITAVGKAKYFNSSFLNKEQTKQALVLDVSINRNELGKLCGDVDVDEMMNANVADNVTVTTVPRGIGVMTTAMLAHNICVLNGMKPWYFKK